MILSVDTGLSNYGLAVIDTGTDAVIDVFSIHTKKSKEKNKRVSLDYEERIEHIVYSIKNVLYNYPDIKAIAGEMPVFGAQSSNSTIGLTAGATIILTIGVMANLPTFWASPGDIKEYFTGDPEASKKDIMKACCQMYGWDITHKPVKQKGKPDRLDAIYHVMERKYGSGKFEHIADAIAAYHTCKRDIIL